MKVTMPEGTQVGDLLAVQHKPDEVTYYRMIGVTGGVDADGPIFRIVSNGEAEAELKSRADRERINDLCARAIHGRRVIFG